MSKNFVLGFLFSLLAAVGFAQTPATINVVTPTACVVSIDQSPINGTLSVYAPNKAGTASPYSATVGLVTNSIASRNLSGGQLQNPPLTLANPAVTSPPGIGYTFNIVDNKSGRTTTYANVAITPDVDGNWNICSLQAGQYQTAFPSQYFSLNPFSILGTSPIVVAFNAGVYTISCPSCGSGHGGTNPPAGTGVAEVTAGAFNANAVAAPVGAFVGTTDTQTLTNKTVDGVTPTVFGFVDPTSSIQTQLDSKQAALGYTPAQSGANSDITSLAGLTTPLSTAQGGTGAGALTGYRLANGASADTASTTIPLSATTGTLNHSQLPALVSGDIPNNSANTSGNANTATTATTAGSLNAASALPNGTTATTQTTSDATTDVATDAFVHNALPTSLPPNGSAGGALAGTYPNPTIATVNASPGSCGDATHSCSITDNAAGQVTAQTNNAISFPTVVANLSGGALGSTPYQSALNATAFASPNTTTTRKFLRETGDGVNGTAPAYDVLVSGDIPNNTANTTGNANTATTAGSATTAGNLSGTPTLPNGTKAATQTAGDSSQDIATDSFVATAIAAFPGQTGVFTLHDCVQVAQVSPLLFGDAGAACGTGGGGITILTGDVTTAAGGGSQAATLATVNGSPGTFGDGTHVAQVTVNGKGLATAASSVAITFPTQIANLTGGVTGSVPYQSAANTTGFVSPNTSTTRKFVVETGTGTVGQIPTVDVLASGDIPNNTANTTGNANTATTATTSTNVAGGAVGSIHYQSAASTTAMLAGNTAATDQVVVSHGTGAAAQAPTLSNAPALSAANMTSFPTLNQNTTGTASNVSGTPALPNGVTATTQTTADNTTKLATDAFVQAVLGTIGGMTWPATAGIANCTGTPCTAWGTSYNSGNTIPANIISTLNQNTTGNAATATSATTATNVAGGVVGSVPYQTAANTTALLAGNTAATDQAYISHGTGAAAQAPTLNNAPALSAANMTSFPTFNQNTTGNAATATSATTATNVAGGTLGAIHYQSAANTTAMLSGNTASTDQVVISHGSAGVATAPTLGNAPALSAANMTSFPTLNQNTTGTASNVSGTPALPNGVTATTQTTADSTTKLATDAFVQNVVAAASVGTATNIAGGAVGSLPYQSAASTTLFLSGNTAATDQVPVSHGTGAAAQAPTLSNAPALSAANMTSFPTLNQNTTGNAATATSATTATNIAGGAVGAIPYQTAAGATSLLTANTAAIDQVVISHGTGAAGLAPTLGNAPALSAANMTSFPTLNQNTTGTASNLSGTPALPNGVTATTQTAGDTSTKVATDQFVATAVSTAGGFAWPSTPGIVNCTGTPCTAWGTSYSSTNTIPANIISTLNQSTTGNATTATTSTNIAGGALGSMPYQSAANTTGLLAGNTTTGTYVLTSTGNGSISATPAWFNLFGTANTYTANQTAPQFITNGTTAGVYDLAQGTDNTGSSPCTVATSICFEAPTSVTSYTHIYPGVAAAGVPTYAVTSGKLTESIAPTTGIGNVVMSQSPTLITPTLGGANATTLNGITITPIVGTTTTLTLALGSTLTLNGAFNTQFTGSANATFTLPGASDTLAGLSASQVFTNKSISLSQVNSGFTAGCFLGASSTTTAVCTAYTANAIPKMASSATTPVASSLLDNGTDVVTTEPSYASNGNQLNGTTATSITSTSLATTGIAFPATYATTARTYRGLCHVSWEQATGVATVQFGISTSAAPTHMSLTSFTILGTTAQSFGTGTTDITTATTTAATASITPAATATAYTTELYVTLSAAASANTVTLFGLTSNASDALLIEPGTFCTWLQ